MQSVVMCEMQATVNCKKKPVDYSGDFRSTFRNRISAKKSFLADYGIQQDNGAIHLRKVDDEQEFMFDGSNTKAVSMFLDGEEVAAEIVIEGSGGQTFSFVIAPRPDVYDLGQEGVMRFAEELFSLASMAGVELSEYIDPNPLGICPDDASNIAELVSNRIAEGADYSYHGSDEQADTLGYEDAYDDIEEIDDLEEVEDLDGLADMIENDDYVDGSEGFDMPRTAVIGDPIEPISALADDGSYLDDEDTGQIDLASSIPEIGIVDDDAEEAIDGDFMIEEADLDLEDFDVDEYMDYVYDIDEDIDDVNADEFAKQELAQATGEIGDAYAQLSDFHEELMQKREDALADIKKIQAEYGPIDGETVEEPEVIVTEEDLAPLHGLESIMAEYDRQKSEKAAYVRDATAPDSEDTPLVAKLKDELAHLEQAGELVSSELNDYDYMLAENRHRYQRYIDNLKSEDADAAALVGGLLDLAQEQASNNEKINGDLKREKAMREHCLSKLNETSKQLDECKVSLDDAERSTRKAENAKAKSDQFVEDAKVSVQKIVSAAKAKVRQSVRQIDAMRTRVEKAEAEAFAATTAKQDALEERDKAYEARDEALEKLSEEKAHTRELMDECDRQLKGFSDDVLEKMKEQIQRTDDAVAARNAADQRVAQLESELAEANAHLAALQATAAKKDRDLREAREKREIAESEYGDLMLRYNKQVKDIQDTGQSLSKTESELVFARGEIQRLEAELEKAIDARDRAIAERLDAVAFANASATSQINEARAQRNDAVDGLIEAKKEALAANAELLDSMKIALALPGGFGNRKTKLDAIEAAFDTFISRTRQAQALGDTEFVDQPIIKTEVPVEDIISEEIPEVEEIMEDALVDEVSEVEVADAEAEGEADDPEPADESKGEKRANKEPGTIELPFIHISQ